VNVLRSLSRYIALALDGFEIRVAAEEAAGFARPWARIAAATPVAATMHGPRHRECRQSFSVNCFPLAGINGESSLVEALRVEALLLEAFLGGLDERLFSRYSDRRHPARVPLFDYSNVPLYEAVTEDRRAGTARVVETPTLRSFPDPNDDLFYTTACVVRLGWNERVTRDPGWRTVEETRLKARSEEAA
jgi:hypothetical protein